MANLNSSEDVWDLLAATGNQMKDIYDMIPEFQRTTVLKHKMPIMDSLQMQVPQMTCEGRTQQDIPDLSISGISIRGLKVFKEAVKRDWEGIEKLIGKRRTDITSVPSTNAPYLIAVWNELIHAPAPILAIGQTFNASTGNKAKNDDVKVDIVCNGGAQWIRVNTIKNSRLLAEFREIDSYMTSSSESSDEEEGQPSQEPHYSGMDNSVLRMGRALVSAAKANPLDSFGTIPKVTIRLTRLLFDESCLERLNTQGLKFIDKENKSILTAEALFDVRICETISSLLEMGIEVVLGERPFMKFVSPENAEDISCKTLIPSVQVNLDLSMLIALVSDLTHAALPKSEDEARNRFIPSAHERERMKTRKEQLKSKELSRLAVHTSNPPIPDGSSDEENEYSSSIHSRALITQIMQEMRIGLIQMISERLRTYGETGSINQMVEFWTTPEARGRCLRIVNKIGGEGEKRRANALFHLPSQSDHSTAELEDTEARHQYWLGSRYVEDAIPIAPIHVYETNEPPLEMLSKAVSGYNINSDIPSKVTGFISDPFWEQLENICRQLLSQGTIDPPEASGDSGEIQRAAVMEANNRLTRHTVHSLLWGAVLRRTTLTANKSSIRAVLRDIRSPTGSSVFSQGSTADDVQRSSKVAAIWVVEPRSLAEGMRGDLR